MAPGRLVLAELLLVAACGGEEADPVAEARVVGCEVGDDDGIADGSRAAEECTDISAIDTRSAPDDVRAAAPTCPDASHFGIDACTSAYLEGWGRCHHDAFVRTWAQGYDACFEDTDPGR